MRAPGFGVSIQNERKMGNSSPLGLRGVDGETARGEAVALAAADGAEVARALKHHVLVEIVRAVDGPVDAEAGEAVRRSGIHLADERPESKEALVGHETLGGAVLDEPDLDGRVEKPAHGQQLDLEVEILAAPDRLIGAEANVAELIVGELAERLRQRRRRLGEGLR